MQPLVQKTIVLYIRILGALLMFEPIFEMIYMTSHTTNTDVLQKIGVKETTMLNNLKNRKLSYAGHIMRNTSGHYDTLMTTMEG